MNGIPQKVLIDTNIIIHLEDNKEIDAKYSEMTRICSEYGIHIYIHESSYQDILRDKNEERKKISLSKLEKYERIHKTPRTKQQKEAKFGIIKNAHDDVDTDLLVSLGLGVTDLLITEDKALKARVQNSDLEQRVLNIDDALATLNSLLGAVFVNYKNVQDKYCNQYHHDQDFFTSLKADYPEFETWYTGCMAKQRPCWVIEQQTGLAGMIIYKDESRHDDKDKQELDALKIPGDKVLKLCLFKIDENIRGEKFGELLLKKAMDYAYRNGYDSTYLTVFPKHATLIKLISRLGFQKSSNKGGEEVYFKYTKVVTLATPPSPFDFHKLFWPCIKVAGVDKYCIPIQPQFHQRLFPEAAEQFNKQLSFSFPTDTQPQTPGNAIQKVYICNAQTKSMNPGDILLFYRSQDSAITSVGVLEDYSKAADFNTLKSLVGRRSVYSDKELLEMTKKKNPAKAINFYYAENFSVPVHLAELKAHGVLKGRPQSITAISEAGFKTFYSALLDKEDRGIFYE